MDFLIGADPEFFVKKDGQFVSAHGLIEGTKANPLKVDGGAVQVDGMALEFNINPARTFEEFNGNIDKVLSTLREMVGPEYEFVFEPVASFTPEYIANQPEEARRLGCDPDFSAWDKGAANPVPNAAANFRTASGHIHVGWADNDMDIRDPEHLEACIMMVKQLDVSVGAISTLWDRDNTRRQLYGKAGAFRPKSYGVEYRVMSNVWLNLLWTRRFVFERTKVAFDYLLKGNNYGNKSAKLPQYINNGDFTNACYIANNYFHIPDNCYDEYRACFNKRDSEKYQDKKIVYSTEYNQNNNLSWLPEAKQIPVPLAGGLGRWDAPIAAPRRKPRVIRAPAAPLAGAGINRLIDNF